MAAEATDADPVARGPGAGRRRRDGAGAASPSDGGTLRGRRGRFRGRAGPALALAAAVLLAVAGGRWARAALRGPLAAVPGLAGDSVATLLLVLRPADCDSYRPLLAEWDRLHRRGDVRVVGAVVDGPKGAAARDSLAGRLGVDFRLRHDLGGVAEKLALRLGYIATPLSVMLDRRGRPRAVVPPVPGRGRADGAARVAAAHLDLLAAGEGPP